MISIVNGNVRKIQICGMIIDKPDTASYLVGSNAKCRHDGNNCSISLHSQMEKTLEVSQRKA